MFIRLRKGISASQPSMSAAFGALDAVLNPAAARAREELEAQHEKVVSPPYNDSGIMM